MRRSSQKAWALLRERYTRLCGTALCPFNLWRRRKAGVMADVHALATRALFHGHAPPVRLVARLVAFPFWLLHTARFIARAMRTCAPEVRERMGKGLLRQAGEQTALSILRGIPTEAYYQYELFLPERRAAADQYLFNGEGASFFPFLNNYCDTTGIQDKVVFYSICLGNGLPVPEMIGRAERGQLILSRQNGEERLPARDMFVKPVSGQKGEGCIRLTCLEGGLYRDHLGRLLSESEVRRLLAEASLGEDYLVQGYIENHPHVRPVTNGALAAVRIVTTRRRSGRIELLASVFKMPTGRAHTNTLGITSPVESRTGALGRAYSYRPYCAGFDAHPDTGAKIVGLEIPFWEDAVRLVLLAHRLFPNYIFIGWDVAISGQGPILLEGNQCWDVLTMQRPHGVPLGRTLFAEVCGEHLEALRRRRC